MLEQLAASELLPGLSSFNKALEHYVEKIVEKIDNIEKACEKLMIY